MQAGDGVSDPSSVLLFCARAPGVTLGGIQRLIIHTHRALERQQIASRILAASQLPGVGRHNKRLVYPGALSAALQPAPGLVHFYGSSCLSTVQLARICRLRGIPFIWTPCFHPFHTQRYPRLSRLYFNRIERRAMSAALHVFALSQRESRFFQAQFPGMPITRFQALLPELPARDGKAGHAGTPAEIPPRRHVLYVGRRAANKGFDHLAALDARMAEAGIEVVAVTDPAPEDRFRAIHCTGPISDERLDALYRTARVCVVPARYESFSLVVVEALSRGTPVILSDQVGAVEPLAGHPACTVLPLDDAFLPNLYQAIQEAATRSPEQMQSLSREARRAITEFRQSASLEDVAQLHGQLLARNGRWDRSPFQSRDEPEGE